MEYRLPAVGDFYQLAAARRVDGAVRMQYAEHDAVSAVFDQQCSVAAHGDKFLLRIAEAASARTPHSHQRNAYALLRLDQSAQRRGQPAGANRGAQFDAVGAATFGGPTVIDGRSDDLQQDAGHASSSLAALTIDFGEHGVEYSPKEIAALPTPRC